jgi:hypothetical protein
MEVSLIQVLRVEMAQLFSMRGQGKPHDQRRMEQGMLIEWFLMGIQVEPTGKWTG